MLKNPDKSIITNIYMVPSGIVFKKKFREMFECKLHDRVQDVIDRIGKEEFLKRVRKLACIVVERSDKDAKLYDIPWYADKVDASLNRTMQAVALSIQTTARRRMAYLARRNSPLIKIKNVDKEG
jgi:hypothetical protein